MCFLQRHDLIGMPSCSHRGSCFTWAWPFGNWRFMGLYLPLCKSGLPPLKSTDVKIWVNKGESRPGAVIPALLLLFRLGFQTYNCNIFFLSFGNVDWGWAVKKRKNRCRLALQSCSTSTRAGSGGRLPAVRSLWMTSLSTAPELPFLLPPPLSQAVIVTLLITLQENKTKKSRLHTFLIHYHASKPELPQHWRYSSPYLSYIIFVKYMSLSPWTGVTICAGAPYSKRDEPHLGKLNTWSMA